MASTNCYSCGFLGKYVSGTRTPTPKFFAIVQEERMNGKIFTHTIDSLAGPRPSWPVCFRREKQAEDDFFSFQDPKMRDPKVACTLMNKERECASWYPYTPGLDPKEHLQELRMHQLELDRRQFEQKMALDHQEVMRKIDSSNKRFQFQITLVLGGIAVLEILVGLLQVLYPTGWSWLQGIFHINSPAPPSIPSMPPF